MATDGEGALGLQFRRVYRCPSCGWESGDGEGLVITIPGLATVLCLRCFAVDAIARYPKMQLIEQTEQPVCQR